MIVYSVELMNQHFITWGHFLFHVRVYLAFPIDFTVIELGYSKLCSCTFLFSYCISMPYWKFDNCYNWKIWQWLLQCDAVSLETIMRFEGYEGLRIFHILIINIVIMVLMVMIRVLRVNIQNFDASIIDFRTFNDYRLFDMQ